MNNFKELFEKILTIIGYKGNKEELYNQLLGICYLNAVDQLIESLSEENKEVVRKEIAGISDLNKLQETVSKYFSQDQLNEALKKASESVFREYIFAIKDTLSDFQVNELKSLADAPVIAQNQ
jgi:hypothetical protein